MGHNTWEEEEGAPSRAANAKRAKRLAHVFATMTDWREYEQGLARGFPVEIQGDNMATISWLNGEWKIHNRVYSRQIAEIQNEFHELHEEFNVVGAAVGGNIGKHVYREGNQRADELTHIARVRDIEYDITHDLQEYDLLALRGAFDGGVDKDKAGAGWWLEGLVKASASHPIYGSFAFLDRPQWMLIKSKAFGLPSQYSAMNTEFEALSSLCEAIFSVTRNFARRVRLKKRTVAAFGSR